MDEIYNRYMQRYDVFLAEDLDTFDWEGFFDRYFFESYYIVEAVDYVGRKTIDRFNNTSYTDTYVIRPIDELKFIFTLNFIESSNKLDALDGDIMNCMMFVKTKICNQLQQVYQHISKNSDKYVCDIMFTDTQGRTSVTGEAGKYAFYVIKSIENTLERIILRQNNKSNVSVLGFCSSKSEHKRHRLYMQLLKRIRLRKMFKEIIEDTVSNDTYNTIYVLI